MSHTQNSGTGIAFRTPRADLFLRTAGRTGIPQEILSPASPETAGPGILERFCEQFRLNGIDMDQDEYHELHALDQFLECHVQLNKIYDVQCMLLWSEWVRTFRNQATLFPKLILEKEFRNVILNSFQVEIAHDGFRGPVYSGLRFVP